MRTLLAAFILSASFPALASECNSYVARDYPEITISESDADFIVKWDRYSETYPKVMTKAFGVLVEGAAALGDPAAQTHYVTRDAKTGGMIFDSIVFEQDCN